MSTWAYRAVLHDLDPEPWVGLHEVHYDAGQVSGWTRDPVPFVCGQDEVEGDRPVGLTQALSMASADLRHSPMLKESELPGSEETGPTQRSATYLHKQEGV
ncbi:hypothetical protein LCGC14_2475370 [marine sediment metagenome]|uniref:Uncharacterized protein n=1 Tax=marine sediment metagenome TaxID=412755 RepID=A0A0F9E2Z2_9ZZZZ